MQWLAGRESVYTTLGILITTHGSSIIFLWQISADLAHILIAQVWILGVVVVTAYAVSRYGRSRLTAAEEANRRLQRELEERRRIEDQLRRSEDRFAKIFQQSPIAISITRENDSHIVDVNDAALKLMGYSREQYVGADVITLGNWVSLDDRQQMLDELREKGAVHGREYQFRVASGEIRDGLMFVERIELDGVPHKMAWVLDVTELRAVQRSLSRATHDLETIINASPDLYFQLSPDGVFLNVLGSAEKLFHNPEAFLGKRAADFMAPAHAGRWDGALDQARETGQVVTYEWVAERAGKPEYYEVRAVPVPDGEFLVIVQDITARKQAEEALRASEARYRALMEQANEAIWITDHAGVIEAANSAASLLTGYTIAEMMGTNLTQLFLPPEDHAGESGFSKALRTTQVMTESRVRRKDGAVLYVEGSIKAIDSRIAQAIFRDVTQRKQIEHDLLESEQLFREIAENITHLIFVRDVRQNRLIYLGPTFEAMWGRERTPFYDNPRLLLDYVHPDDRARIREILSRQEIGQTGSYEYRIIHPDGEIRWVSSRTFPIKNERGDVYRIVGLINDITERKQLEYEMLESERLRAELEKEREVSQLKEKFVTMVSHEFRTPLTVIMSSVELMERYRDRLSNERRDEHLKKILSQTRHMTDMLGDILEYQAITKGPAGLTLVATNLVELAHRAADRVQHSADAPRSIEITSEGQLTDLMLDRKLVEGILVNLLSNAVKFSPADSAITVSLARDGAHVVLRVIDRGIGIPPEDQQRIFEPFYRAGNVSNRRGTGLGLAIAVNNVELHQGSIACDSQPGAGSTFTVRLPLRIRE